MASHLGIVSLVLQLLHADVLGFVLDSGLSDCQRFEEYNSLLKLAGDSSCNSLVDVAKTLDDLYKKEKIYNMRTGHCLEDVIDKMSAYFGSTQSTPSYCSCHGSLSRVGYAVRIHGMNDHFNQCYRVDSKFTAAYYYFLYSDHSQSPDCQTHHALWHRLMSDSNYNTHCQSDMVEHLGYGYKHHPQSCQCSAASDIHPSVVGYGRSECQRYPEYNELLQLADNRSCDSVVEVVQKLDTLYKNAKQYSDLNAGVCLSDVVDRLSDYYGNMESTPPTCSCSGSLSLVGYHSTYHDNMFDYKGVCQESSYQAIYSYYLDNTKHQDPACTTHHTLWPRLKYVSHHHGIHCQSDVIEHLGYGYKHSQQSCKCSYGSPVVPVTHGETIKETDTCRQYHSYSTLLGIYTSGMCVSVSQVWQYLDDLVHTNEACRKKLVKFLAGQLTQQPSIPDECTCLGTPVSQHLAYFNNNTGNYDTCKKYDVYEDLKQKLFDQAEYTGCHTHHFVWQALENLPIVSSSVDCQQDFIRHASLTIKDPTNDPCICQEVTTTTKSIPTITTSTTAVTKTATTTTSTTADAKTATTTTADAKTATTTSTTAVAKTATTTTSTTTVPKTATTTISTTDTPTSATTPSTTHAVKTATTTVKMPLTTNVMTSLMKATTQQNIGSIYTCDKLHLIQAIALNLSASDPNSFTCDPARDKGSNEDLILTFCDVSDKKAWHKGLQVSKHCGDIPLYSPVATFHSDVYYYTPDVQTGIFIGCVDKGFRMAVQQCNSLPTIIHIETSGPGQSFTSNPDSYYTLMPGIAK